MRVLCIASALALVACASDPPAPSRPVLEDFPIADAGTCPGYDPARLGPLSAALVLDTSASTKASSGVDVNANGVVGSFADSSNPRLGQIFAESSDPGDSYLSATVASVRNIAHTSVGPKVRFAIISFSGQAEHDLAIPKTERSQPDAVLHAPLTSDVEHVERALSEILEFGSGGATRFAPAMSIAIEALRDDGSQPPPDRKLVLFISDSPTPVLGQRRGKLVRAEPEMKDAAVAAINDRVVFHTFGISQAATSPEPHALSRIAGATGGRYRAVTDPLGLTCALAQALMP